MFLLGSLYLVFVFYPLSESSGGLIHDRMLAFIYIPALSVLGSTVFQMIRSYVKKERILLIVSIVHIFIFVFIGYFTLASLFSFLGTVAFMIAGVGIGVVQYKILKRIKSVFYYETNVRS